MPTINIQMSADTYLRDDFATTNFSTAVEISVGEYDGAVSISRAWIKPDFTGIPAGQGFVSAVLNLTPITDVPSNSRTMSAHRCLRDVVANQATWTIWKTSNNWGTAGCSNSTTDYDGALALGTMTQPASPTLNTALQMTFTAAGVSELQKMYDGTYTNNGIILFVDTQTNDQIQYASLDNATSAYRPFITIVYGSGGFFF